MTPEQAIEIVATDIVAGIRNEQEPQWEDYPDIGEYDWERIDARVHELLQTPPKYVRSQFEAAYAALKERAQNS